MYAIVSSVIGDCPPYWEAGGTDGTCKPTMADTDFMCNVNSFSASVRIDHVYYGRISTSFIKISNLTFIII